jgi:hypothetical protein
MLRVPVQTALPSVKVTYKPTALTHASLRELESHSLRLDKMYQRLWNKKAHYVVLQGRNWILAESKYPASLRFTLIDTWLTTDVVWTGNWIYWFFFSMGLPAYFGSWPLIQFHNHFSQTVRFLGRVISSSQGLYLNRGQHKHRKNAYTH